MSADFFNQPIADDGTIVHVSVSGRKVVFGHNRHSDYEEPKLTPDEAKKIGRALIKAGKFAEKSGK